MGALKVWNSTTGQWEYTSGSREYSIDAKNMSDAVSTYTVGVTHFSAGAAPNGGTDYPLGATSSVVTFKHSTNARSFQQNVSKDGSRVYQRGVLSDNISWANWFPVSGVVVVTSSTRPGSPMYGEEIFETDTKRKYIWDGSAWNWVGGGTNPDLSTAMHRGRMTKSSNQNISGGTPATMSFQVEDYDVGGVMDVANNRIVIQRSGFYTFSAGGQLNGAVGLTDQFSIQLIANGSWELATGVVFRTDNANNRFNQAYATYTGYFVATDYIEVEVFSNSAQTLDTGYASIPGCFLECIQLA